MKSSQYRVTNDMQVKINEGTTDTKYDLYLQQLEQLKIKILTRTDEEIVFDLIGVEAPIANALRRILLAEVPTVAIENIYISENTSIIQDEVLSHRLGLIPIKCDPSKLEYVQGEEETDSDTVVFQLDASCPQSNAETDKTDLILSSQLQWIPQGNQEERFPEGVTCAHNDIVVAKLKAGQRIALEAHARKGVGKDHTKFSPVATASYRLLPVITFPTPIIRDKAHQLVNMCPMKVFDIEDIRGIPTAVASRPRDCTMCRECIRNEGWQDAVHLKRQSDHFIFSVETVGTLTPENIVLQAIGILREKAQLFLKLVDIYEAREIMI